VSALRRRGLKLDDPLGPSQTPRPDEPPAQSDNASIPQAAQNRPPSNDDRAAKPTPAPRRTSRAQRQRSTTVDKQPAAAAEPAAPTATGVWREWSATTSVGSFRLPHELLIELGDTARELGLPIGLIVTAAITQLLDQRSEQIAALVDRADDARIHARRRARRPLKQTER
jgi:hypothetical protein